MKPSFVNLALNVFTVTLACYVFQQSGFLFAPDECESWRLNVELGNIRNWAKVPPECVSFVGRYMRSGQYQSDIHRAIDEARSYLLNEVVAVGDGFDAWVLDVDETAISNLDYYASIDYGGSSYNHTKYFEWVKQGHAIAINETLAFYNELTEMGFKVFFITGRRCLYRNLTEAKLLQTGFTDWSGVLMREPDDQPGRVSELKISKRMKLVQDGYRIWGNIGDQWSDITGHPVGNRVFKLPNPMYYVS